MRIWSLHPKFLDARGLVALWRETLLARKVLEGKTKGYRRHPQLERFKRFREPVAAINSYLYFVFEEAARRGYHFDQGKIYSTPILERVIPVTNLQLKFEFEHLLSKLRVRDPSHAERIAGEKLDCNPVFFVVEGEIEPWEKRSPLGPRTNMNDF
ncbi:MAG: pyrimidine dimer DNA glycosylase/endonuclease V [Thermofilum sp.]